MSKKKHTLKKTEEEKISVFFFNLLVGTPSKFLFHENLVHFLKDIPVLVHYNTLAYLWHTWHYVHVLRHVHVKHQSEGRKGNQGEASTLTVFAGAF